MSNVTFKRRANGWDRPLACDNSIASWPSNRVTWQQDPELNDGCKRYALPQCRLDERPLIPRVFGRDQQTLCMVSYQQM